MELIRKKPLRGTVILLIATIAWGFSYVMQSKAMDYLEPLTYNGIRILVGGIALIPVDLVERLPDSHTAPLQLHMDHRETVDQDRHIIAVAVPRSFVLADGILVDDLKKIVVDVLLVKQSDVLGGAVIPF